MTQTVLEDNPLQRLGYSSFHPAQGHRVYKKLSLGSQDASAALGTGSHLSKRERSFVGSSLLTSLQTPGTLTYCLLQRWLNCPDTDLTGTL